MPAQSNELESRVTDLLSRLVACPSVNPDNRPNPQPPFGERRLAELLNGLLVEWGMETRMDEVEPGRLNVIARLPGRDAKRSLMLEAHSDTVQVGDMTIDPFDPVVREGRLYGRGSCDTKGPMAAMLEALRTIIEEGEPPPMDVYFVATCNEERGATGAAALMKQGFRASAAVVGEPTELTIMRAHKGVARWRVTTRGVSAHSSTPEKGANAIVMMSKVMERIDGPIAARLAERRNPLLGAPTVSIGTIQGGTQINVVPSQCSIEVDRRLLPSESPAAATAELTRELDDLKAQGLVRDYAIEPLDMYPPFEEPEDSAVCRLVETVCEDLAGKAAFGAAPYATNAGFFKQAGVPCVVFGPGSAAQAHTVDEFIELRQVFDAVPLYAEIIRRSGDWLCSDG